MADLKAQTESNRNLRIETGLLWASDEESRKIFDLENLGLFIQVEPTLKTSRTTFMGLRIGVAANTQTIEDTDPTQFYYIPNLSTGLFQLFDVDNRVISVVPNFNYKFSEHHNTPYLGLGIGYYFLTNYTDVSRRDISIPHGDPVEISLENQVGILMRAGLHFDKVTAGLEFNLVPKSNVQISNGQIIGTVSNSYAGLSLGYNLPI